ncbi:hypothetical protein CRYUN_Cryun32bG0008000 [Craigia yunnanensis]
MRDGYEDEGIRVGDGIMKEDIIEYGGGKIYGKGEECPYIVELPPEREIVRTNNMKKLKIGEEGSGVVCGESIWDVEREEMGIRDFNDVASIMEKEGGRRKERRKVECFQEMIRDSDLNEVHFKGQQFTWFGMKEGELIKERLDRVLANLEWLELFHKIQVFNLPAVGSDHSPIVVDTDFNDGKAVRRFKFEAKWLLVEELRK